MAYFNSNVPRPNDILSFSIDNFSGGINNITGLLESNQSADCLNMSFTNSSVMEKRKGVKYVEKTAQDSDILFVDEYKPYNKDNVLITATNTHVFADGEVVRQVDGRVRGVNFNGNYLFVDGKRIFMYGTFDEAPSTYVKIQGTQVTTPVVLQMVNPPVNYVPLEVSHARGVHVYDFTTMTTWYEPCKNEMSDVFKGANLLPESPQYIVTHNGRVYCSGMNTDDDTIYISDVGNGFYFPSGLSVQIPPDSDRVRSLSVFDNAVVIGREYDVYVLRGETNNTSIGLELFTLKKLNTHTGVASNEAIVRANNYLFFLGNDGVAYSLMSTSTGTRDIVSRVLSSDVDFSKEPFSISLEDVPSASSVYFKDEWHIAVGGFILVYSYRFQAWTYYKGYDPKCFYNQGGALLMACGNQIATQSEDYLDFGYPYRAFWKSKLFDMGDSYLEKHFREFFVVANTFKNFKSIINLTFEIDYADIDSEVSISNQMSIYGEAKFGDRFISRNINTSLPFPIRRRGRGIRFIFSNGYDVSDTVQTYDELYRLLGRINGSVAHLEPLNKFFVFKNSEWVELLPTDYNQPMLVYQMNGQYEFRGKR